MKQTLPKTITRFAGAMLLVAASIWTARADFTSTIQALNPVAYWPFDETAASPAPYVFTNSGTVGRVGDAHGIVGLTNGVAGIVGNAISFYNPTGAGGVSTYANVNYNPGLNTKVFSIEFWVKPSASVLSGVWDATGACPLSNFSPNYSGGSRVGYLFYLAPSGVWNFRLGLTSGYAASLIATNGTATANTWQHVVATYDGSTVKLYINGQLSAAQASSAAATGWTPNNGSFLRFGNNSLFDNTTISADGNIYLPAATYPDVSGNRGFDGVMDEVAVYTNVLSAATVAAHHTAASNPATYDATILADNPSGYWNLDEPLQTPPAPSTFPLASNAGTLGGAADGTNIWGAVAGQPGPQYSGLAANDKSVAFDGYNGSFTVKDAPGLRFTNNITMAAWVKPLADNYVHDIIEHGFDGTGKETFLRITRGYAYGFDSNGALPPEYDGVYYGYYEVGATEGENGDGWYDSALFPILPGDIGNWVFLAGTFDGSNWNLYRNGVLVATYPAYDNPGVDSDTGAIAVDGPWTIGSRSLPWPVPGFSDGFYGDGNTFAGSIDEPAIFTNALSDTDILNLYHSANVPPVLTVTPKNPGTVFKGSTQSFTVLAEGNPTIGYLWTSNGIPTGDTTTTYSIDNINAGTYTVGVIATNSFGTNSSAVTFSAITQPPAIVAQPLPQSRYVGFPFTLSVSAGGTAPLTYYWYLGSTLVQGGPVSTYSTTASLGNAGNYSVVVSNETSISVTSAPVAVNVYSVPGGYPDAVVGSTPQSYWRLDETSGSTAFDLIGGNNGTYNLTTLGLPGYSVLDPDTAAGFSGDGSYVGNISGVAINFTNNVNFTLEAWVNAPSGQSDEASIIAKGIGSSGTTETEQFALDVSGGAYRFFTTYNGNKFEADGSSGPNGTWQHIVGVYDAQNALGGGTKLYIYVNGVQEGSVNVPTRGQSSITSQVSIGSKRLGNDPAYNGTFNGTVDEVAVYNYALSPSTIAAHYSAAYGTTLAPVITIEPSSETNYLGLPITLSVETYGSQPLTFQWYHDGSPVGPNSGTFTIPTPGFGDIGNYYVNVANNINNTNSATVYVSVLAPPTSPPAIPGLVLHLPFNGNLNDVTGRGNNGTGKHSTQTSTNTVVPGPATSPDFYYVTDGPFNGSSALHYSTVATNSNGTAANGSSGGTNDYYVTLGVSPDLQFGSNINFTVSLWIRTPLGYGIGPDYGGGGDLPFFTTALKSLGGPGFDFATAYAIGTANPIPAVGTPLPPVGAGGWATSIYQGPTAGGGIRLYGLNGSIDDNNWHNLIYVINRSTGLITTYLDGVVAAYTKPGGTKLNDAGNIDSGHPATIGQDPTGLYGETGSSDIADLGVWRRALTPLEAGAIYSAGFNNGLSFAYVPITFTSTHDSTTFTLTWTLGTLQSATSVNGPFTDVSGATSPYTVPSTSGNLFFRVRYTYQ